ncbi:MAG: hypothetical protein AAGC90_13185 [Curtobacterium sp.]
MTIQISGVHVLADDIDAAVAFSRDTIGFSVRDAAVRDPAGNMVRIAQA